MDFFLGFAELTGQFLYRWDEILLFLNQTGNVIVFVSDTLLNAAQRCRMIIREIKMLLQFQPQPLSFRLRLLQLLLQLFRTRFGNLEPGTQFHYHRL